MDDNTGHIVPKPKSVEPLFREELQLLLEHLGSTLPEDLYEEAFEHRWRRDGSGATLCFGGPLRDDLMARLLPWLDAEAPDTAARPRAGYVPSTDTWPGPVHYPPVDRVPKPVAAVAKPAPQITLFPKGV